MPKSRARKHKNRNRIARTQQQFINHSVFRKIRSKVILGKTIAVMVAIIGVVGSYVTIFGYWSPRISVQPLQSLNPRDALSSEFSVTNQGAMDIYDVAIGFSFINFKLRKRSPELGNAPSGTEPHYEIIRRTGGETNQIGDIAIIVPGEGRYPKIAPLRSGTSKIPFSMLGEEDLEIAVIVYYRSAWYPFQRYETFRFVTRAALDGQIHWVQLPVPEL